jgi:hypothetical protein
MFVLVQFQNKEKNKEWFPFELKTINYMNKKYLVIPDHYNKISKIMFNDFKEIKITKSNSINPIWTPFTLFNIGSIDKNDKFCYDISNHDINYEILVENKKEIIYKIPMIEKKLSRESPNTFLKNKDNMITAIFMNIDETKMFYIPIYLVIKAIEKKSQGIHIKDFNSKFITHKEMGIKIPSSLNDMIECDIGVNEIKELGRIVITKEIKKNVETIASLHQIISS